MPVSAAVPSEPIAPSPWRASLRAARANFIPGLILQAFAAALVAAYFLHAPTHAALENLAAFRDSIGMPFALVSTALFGAVLPLAMLRLRASTRHRYNGLQMGALTVFWAYKGFEFSVLYILQAKVFGEGQAIGVIAAKTFVDQFVYGTLLGTPLTWLVYSWVERKFDFAATAALFRPGWYLREVLPMLFATWGVWLPTVIVIYLLPTGLQLPLQNVVLYFFTLLVTFMTARPTAKPSA